MKGKLTIDERRRVFVVREHSQRLSFAPLPSAPVVLPAPLRRRILPGVVTALVIGVLLAAGSLAGHGVEFHPPRSLLEAVVPRA